MDGTGEKNKKRRFSEAGLENPDIFVTVLVIEEQRPAIPIWKGEWDDSSQTE